MTEKQIVTVPYCSTCKGICFNYTQSEAQYKNVSYTMDIDGRAEEVCDNTYDGETYDKYCDECGDPLTQEVSITLPLYQRIFERVCKGAEKATVNIFKCDLKEDPSDLSVEDTELKICEALL